jgi:hypothetical protein
MLPLPIYVLAGAFLAIASNYDRGMGLLFNQAPSSENVMQTQTAVIIEPEPKILTSESIDLPKTSVNIE